jgi:hypothetical protein
MPAGTSYIKNRPYALYNIYRLNTMAILLNAVTVEIKVPARSQVAVGPRRSEPPSKDSTACLNGIRKPLQYRSKLESGCRTSNSLSSISKYVD